MVILESKNYVASQVADLSCVFLVLLITAMNDSLSTLDSPTPTDHPSRLRSAISNLFPRPRKPEPQYYQNQPQGGYGGQPHMQGQGYGGPPMQGGYGGPPMQQGGGYYPPPPQQAYAQPGRE